MVLPVFLMLAILIFVLMNSFRIQIELSAREEIISYTIRGSILKVITLFKITDNDEKKSRKPQKSDGKEKGSFGKRVFEIIREAILDHRGKIIHIERLSVDGTFSIEDAAANAILYGIFLSLWQFLLIFLAANFRLEHQSYNFLPDFRNDRNEFIFQLIFRVVILNMVLLVIHTMIVNRKKKI